MSIGTLCYYYAMGCYYPTTAATAATAVTTSSPGIGVLLPQLLPCTSRAMHSKAHEHRALKSVHMCAEYCVYGEKATRKSETLAVTMQHIHTV